MYLFEINHSHISLHDAMRVRTKYQFQTSHIFDEIIFNKSDNQIEKEKERFVIYKTKKYI